MENPINMDDLGVPLFLETPIWFFGDLNRLTFFNLANHQGKTHQQLGVAYFQASNSQKLQVKP